MRPKSTFPQAPIVRTETQRSQRRALQRADLVFVGDGARLVVCEMKVCLDSRILLQGLTYARHVHRSLDAWQVALGMKLDPRVALYLVCWGAHRTWLELLEPLRRAYSEWLAEIRYYAAWNTRARRFRCERIDGDPALWSKLASADVDLGTREHPVEADDIRRAVSGVGRVPSRVRPPSSRSRRR